MSWWISLRDSQGNYLETDTICCEGGTQVVGGTSEAVLNVTYNYSKHFYFPKLQGLTAIEAKPILSEASEQLKDDTDKDYWKATEGNAKRAIQTLLDFCEFAIRTNRTDAKFVVN